MRLLTVLLLTCVALLPAISVHAAPQKSPPTPLLWKVSDSDNSVYLLGSFHLLKPDDYPLSKDVDAALADASSVMFEIPPEDIASPVLAMQMGQAGLRKDGTQLDSELGPVLSRKLETWLAANDASLKKAAIPAQMLQLFEPWFVGLTISLVEMTDRGLDPKLGLDLHLARQAKAKGKPTSGLETGTQQIAFLDSMDHDEQLQFLDEELSESTQGTQELDKLHAAWRAGDAATLWSGMAVDMKRHYPKLYQHLNVERNDAWLPKIEQRLKTRGRDDTLVVVGALHLLGSDGVVEKLRAKGYKVERICSACK